MRYDKETNTYIIGREWPPCPACKTACSPKWTKCKTCGCELSGGAGGEPSRLSDADLSAELSSLKSRRKLMNAVAGVLVAVFIITAVAGLWIAAFAFALLSAVFLFIGMAYGNSMARMVKYNVVKDALAQVFADCYYHPNAHIAQAAIHSAGLIGGWNRCSGSDYVKGRYRGHAVEFSDVHLENETTHTDSNGHTQTKTETVFKGQWMTCILDKAFDAKVRVREKAERRGLARRLLGAVVQAKSDVETENAAFNRQFQILTADPHTAFYILTPHFMEFIVAADLAANGRTCLCFSGNLVHIAVDNGRDSFEVSHKGPEIKNIPVLRQRIHGEIRYVTAILDELFQNEFLFNKEGK